MPWKYTDEYYREYTRTTWNESAQAYLTLQKNFEPYQHDLIERARIRSGEKVLDLGTGPGEPALTIAVKVGGAGRVVGVDLSEKMIALAQRAAAAREISNVEFRVMDCGALKLPGASFDVAVSSFGFQIFTNPEKAAAEAYRILRPHGRIAVCVWSTGDRVPWIDAIIGPMLKHAEPDETGYIPTPYELGAPGELVAFIESAGFQHALEARQTHAFHWDGEADYLRSVLKATPIGHSLSEESPEVQQEVLRETHANLKQWKRSGGLSIPGECVFVTADK
ncbi:MAG: methyltransferase domain-containing protein [Thermoplasmata archaeon]